MELDISPTASIPPFEQIREQIRMQADSGLLPPGTRLPTVRKLAADLQLAANTVARAYRELEHLGVVETRGRQGSFIARRGEDAEREVRVAAREYLARVDEIGLSTERAVSILTEEAGRANA